MDWTPTAKLRFINRKVPATMSDEGVPHTYTIKILQQWWVDAALEPAEWSNTGQWRDVPLEME